MDVFHSHCIFQFGLQIPKWPPVAILNLKLESNVIPHFRLIWVHSDDVYNFIIIIYFIQIDENNIDPGLVKAWDTT